KSINQKKGTVPPWLQGTLVRVGPGLFSVGETSYDHWFDGMSLLHSFTIKDGNVFYRSRFLRGDTYKANMEAKRIVISEMGTMAYPDSSKSIFSKFITFLNHTVPDFTDNCGNNIIRYGNNFYATSETNYIRKIDPITLETHDKVDYMKYLPVNIVTSHPHYDKEGNAYNMGTSIADKAKTKYILFKVPAEKEGMTSPVLKNTEIICTLPCRSVFSPSYYHSFGMTENFFIFIEQPLKLDILKMATAYMRGVNWASCIKYLPDDNTLIQLIDRRTKKVVHKFYTDAMVVHHLVNAYEEDGHAVLDVIAYCDNSLYDMFYLSKMKEGPESQGSKDTDFTSKYKRLVLPLSDKGAGTGENIVKLKHTTATAVKEKDGKILCHPEILCEGTEVPRINYDLNGKKHRFVYMTCVGSAIATKIGKFDAETKKMIEWSEESCLPSEPVFIPKPNAVEEDDGVVLTSVINLNPGKSFLLVLDAKSFKEVARSYVNTDLHMDMHGYFIPECS
uniref:Beta-carotene oxygenase 1 n=1 Tax=Denticeps clupeoides TaxID=299321 RepID=A0AAY4BK19_9TELE